jgi:pyruvate dehydrogenase E1 component
VWSATSFSELAREAREVQRWNRLHPGAERKRSFVAQCLGGETPIVAATDYIAAYPNLVASFVDAPFVALGTDGFGRSDTRASLRRFFEVDRQHIAVAAMHALLEAGTLDSGIVTQAIERYKLEVCEEAPWAR